MRYKLILAALTLVMLADSQPALSVSSPEACFGSSANCVSRCVNKQQPGSHELYACFRNCESTFLHCLDILPPVKDLEADPARLKKSKRKSAPAQPDTVIE